MQRTVGLSLGSRRLVEPYFEEMMRAGVTATEISVGHPRCDTLDLAQVATAAQNTGMCLWSYHLPFAPFERIDPSSLDAKMRAETVEYFGSLMEKAAAVGVKRFVVHASAEPIEDATRADRLAASADSLDKLSQTARACGAVIAVENLPRTCLGNQHSDILQLIGNNPTLGVCFDTNHLLGESGEEFLAAVGHRLVTLHVSDYDFINERHWLPGEGRVNWPSLMDALDKTGYAGTFLYEMSFSSTNYIKRARELTPADFCRNAKELHQRSPITVWDTPIPNLGMWGVEKD